MPLQPGTTLGSYKVAVKIGEGGMGEVWQARDTKLDRDVALKVLPEAFTSDPDRLARFEREAKVLASLNHPNIGSIYGLEEAEGIKALVLELVEGPTLADRIKQGPIPIDEALPIAKQIAEALEAAHEAGVIHRDLKPANIKVREDGTVKVLDFGLAKAFQPDTSDPGLLLSTSTPETCSAIVGFPPSSLIRISPTCEAQVRHLLVVSARGRPGLRRCAEQPRRACLQPLPFEDPPETREPRAPGLRAVGSRHLVHLHVLHLPEGESELLGLCQSPGKRMMKRMKQRFRALRHESPERVARSIESYRAWIGFG